MRGLAVLLVLIAAASALVVLSPEEHDLTGPADTMGGPPALTSLSAWYADQPEGCAAIDRQPGNAWARPAAGFAPASAFPADALAILGHAPVVFEPDGAGTQWRIDSASRLRHQPGAAGAPAVYAYDTTDPERVAWDEAAWREAWQQVASAGAPEVASTWRGDGKAVRTWDVAGARVEQVAGWVSRLDGRVVAVWLDPLAPPDQPDWLDPAHAARAAGYALLCAPPDTQDGIEEAVAAALAERRVEVVPARDGSGALAYQHRFTLAGGHVWNVQLDASTGAFLAAWEAPH